jgi:aminoglycoside phosphotransferase (APT) family kinase protein
VTEAPSDRELLEGLGSELGGRPITGLRRRPYRFATSAPLEEVTVGLEGADDVVLILKDLARDRLLGDAPAAKPAFLYEPMRELEVYRAIIGPAGIGPRCLASAVEPRQWLLLEKVPGVELWQVGEFDEWEAVAVWLGAFHHEFAGTEDDLRGANRFLLEHDSDWFRSWHRRAAEALERSPDPRARELLEALTGYDEVAHALASLPRTLVHGEFYPSNVLVTHGESTLAVYPVDWEMAAVGPGIVDLAAIAGGWSPEERESLARAYVDGLREAGGPELGWTELATDLRRARLHIALQWLGWASGWRPPKEHAHDWLAEALSLCGEVGLS